MSQEHRLPDWREEARRLLDEERQRFRATLPADIEERWHEFKGRTAAVLSGGGARGGYEAGALLAFEDARLPTHILTSTSIGSVDAASYAAHGDGYVGKAEPLVESWYDVTPTAVGIDWSRYVVVLTGLVLASAGFGNLIRDLIHLTGVYVVLDKPFATWTALGLAGSAILFFYSQLAYAYYVLATRMRKGKRRWHPDRRKLIISSVVNVCLWVLIFILTNYVHVRREHQEIFSFKAHIKLYLGAAAALSMVGWLMLRNRLSAVSHEFLRLPLRSGLFPNFERTRFLRDRIPAGRLRGSPMRVIFTVADIKTGDERYYTNAPIEDIAKDPGVSQTFVHNKMQMAKDLIQAVVASSAYPMAYECTPIDDKLLIDGGIVAVEPVRPAVRLGADVLFLVMVSPAEEREWQIRTFLDVAMRTFDILMTRNLKTDLSILENANNICAEHAAKLGVQPEQVRLE